MPRTTIKSLQAEIKNLRDLRDLDRVSENRLKGELEAAKKQLVSRGLEIEDLRGDKKWLKSLIQNLVVGDNNAKPS